jgi:hypothetical protein
LGRKVAQALIAVRANVIYGDDILDPNTNDVDWLPMAGEKQWIVLSKDKFRERPVERVLLLQAGVRAFYLSNGQMSGPVMVDLFMRHLSRIVNLSTDRSAPFFGIVGPKTVEIRYTDKDLPELIAALKD